MDAYQEKESVQGVNTADDVDVNRIEKDTVLKQMLIKIRI